MATFTQERKISPPVAYPDTERFWQAAAEGVLLLKRCAECDALHYFPRSICPFCGGDRTEWLQASGRGTVYSVSVTRRGPGTPYAIAYVTLEEGVTLMTNIVDCDLDAIRIGDAVEVVFKPTDGGPPVAMFRPGQNGSATQ